MKKLKILHFDFDDLESPSAGGQAVRTFEINRRLAKKGHDVTVITLDYPGAKNKIKEGVKYQRIGLKNAPWSYISFFASIPINIWTHQFDLVVEDNISPFTFGLSPLYTQKPVIAQTQCFFAKQSSQKHHLPFWMFEKYGSKVYKNFIVLTEHMKKQIHTLNKKANIRVVPNGISIRREYVSKEQNYFLFIGRIDYYQKGLHELLAIAEQLKKTLPNYKIIIAGDGPDKTRLLNEIAKLDLYNIEYIGKVEGEKKHLLYQNCVSLLQPSHFEIFPFTILEAASYGKPTVCFNIPNLEEIMHQQIGLTAPAFDTRAFAAKVTELANNDTLRHNYGKKAHDWANKHLWNEIVNQQEDFYYSCIKQ